MDGFTIRKATVEDCENLYNLVKHMREEEGRAKVFVITPEEFKEDGFGENKLFNAVVLESNNVLVGFATYFVAYNGDIGKTLYMEDIYIKPEYRDKGLGSKLFRKIAKITVDTGCRRMEWGVVNEPSWNAKTLAFYDKFSSIDENLKQLYLQGSVLHDCANKCIDK